MNTSDRQPAHLRAVHPTRGRPSRRALAGAWRSLGTGLALTGLVATVANAQGSAPPNPAGATSQTTSFSVAAGALGPALSEFASKAGVSVQVDSRLVEGRHTQGLRGDFTVSGGFAALLQGSGLVVAQGQGGVYFVQASPAATGRSGGPVREAGALRPATNALDPVSIVAPRASTATKSDTPILETPQSISVISAEEMAVRGGIGLQEAMRYSAGVRTEPNGADFRWDYTTIRGGFNAEKLLDGMRWSDNRVIDPFTLERIEVLRGPSSVLYGQGGPGGIINAISKRPQFERGGEIGFEVGSFRRRQMLIDVTGPLDAEKRLAGRLVMVVRDSGTQFAYDKDDRLVFSPSLRWQPSNRTDVVLQALIQRDRAGAGRNYLPVVATLLAAPGQRVPGDRFLGEPGLNRLNNDQNSLSLSVDHRFDDALRLRSAIRYNQSQTRSAAVYANLWSGEENPFVDADHRLLPRYRADYRGRERIFTTDNHLAWTFATGPWRHQTLFGIDYSRVDLRSAGLYTDAAPIDLYSPVYGNVPDGDFEPYPRAVNAQLGFYVQDQMRYRDWLTVIIGARRDRASTATEDAPDQVDRATSLRAGVIANISPSLAPYLSYSESFLPTVGLDFYGVALVPQRGRQIEAGIKWMPSSKTLLTLATFQILGTNRPTNDPENPLNTIQTGEVRSRGVELEASHTITGGFSLRGSYSYVDAKVRRSGDPAELGLPIVGVARHQASFWAQQQFRLGDNALRLGLGLRATGSLNQAIVLDGQAQWLRTPGHVLTDALVEFDRGDWLFRLNATNLFDREYYGGCTARQTCGIGYRRNLIASVRYRF